MFTCNYIIAELIHARKKQDKQRELALFLLYQRVKLYCVKPKTGIVRRHPDPDMWYSDWDRGSGDQYTGLIICAGLFKDRKLLSSLLRSFIKRGFLCTNSFERNIWKDKDEHEKKAPRYRKWTDKNRRRDFRPFFISLFIRGYNFYPLYPVLVVTDFLDLFLGALIKSKWIGWMNKKVRQGNDGNFVAELYYCRERMPTPFSFFAREVYNNTRLMIQYPKDELLEYTTNCLPQAALRYHYRPSSKNPPLDQSWAKVLEGCLLRIKA